jgi:hypothetical protein
VHFHCVSLYNFTGLIDRSQIVIDERVENNSKTINDVNATPTKVQTEQRAMSHCNEKTMEEPPAMVLVKRTRGRPRTKSICVSPRMKHVTGDDNPLVPIPIKKARGRPRTKSMCASPRLEHVTGEDNLLVPIKKPRGRPRTKSICAMKNQPETTPAARRQRAKSTAVQELIPDEINVVAYPLQSLPKRLEHVVKEPAKRKMRSKSVFEISEKSNRRNDGFIKIFRKIKCTSPDTYEIVSGDPPKDKASLVNVMSKRERFHSVVKQLEEDSLKLNNEMTRLMDQMDIGKDLSEAGFDESNWSGTPGDSRPLDLLSDKTTSELEVELADLSESERSSPVHLSGE